jgi:hypothetical protein
VGPPPTTSPCIKCLKQRREPITNLASQASRLRHFVPDAGRVEEALLARYNCCARRFELRNIGLSTNEFRYPAKYFLVHDTFIRLFVNLTNRANIVTNYRVEHFCDGKMLLSFQLACDEFNCLGQFEILTMSEQLMELSGRRCSDLVRLLGPEGREIASWSSARRISCVRALPPPSAKPAGSQKATDMDANEFITHGENLPLSA